MSPTLLAVVAELPPQPHVAPQHQQHLPRPHLLHLQHLRLELPQPAHRLDVEQQAVAVDEVVDADKPVLPQLPLHSIRNWIHFSPTADTACIR